MNKRRLVSNLILWVKSFRSVFTYDGADAVDLLTDTSNGSRYAILAMSVHNKPLPNRSMAENMENKVPGMPMVKYRVLLRSLSSGALSVVPLKIFEKRKKEGRYVTTRLLGKEAEDVYDDEPIIREMQIKGGQLNMSVSGVAASIMARSFGDLLLNQKAPNYIETRFHTPQGDKLLVTVQRTDGKTPHELRAEAEEKIADLEKQLEGLRAV